MLPGPLRRLRPGVSFRIIWHKTVNIIWHSPAVRSVFRKPTAPPENVSLRHLRAIRPGVTPNNLQSELLGD